MVREHHYARAQGDYGGINDASGPSSQACDWCPMRETGPLVVPRHDVATEGVFVMYISVRMERYSEGSRVHKGLQEYFLFVLAVRGCETKVRECSRGRSISLG